MSDYILELKKAILAVHGCKSLHNGSVPVKEVFRGEVAWEGVVEVFVIAGHPKTTRCYAWGYKEGNAWEITAVLEIPPVVSPQTAVKVAIAAHARQGTPPPSRKS